MLRKTLNKIQTEVLVIGGGATGTGILRDLAMRGFQTLLVEQRDLTHGTTGRFHGLLHSGGRYAVKDPEAARECIQENRILRKIMPHCIEDTGGFFVLTPGDDPNYADSFILGCRRAGIRCEEIPIRQMLNQEIYLNPKISQCFHVPDGAVDSFAAAHANVASAVEYGAKVLTYHEVSHLLTSEYSAAISTPRSVVGVLCHDLVRDLPVEIHADLVVNAAGAWVGKIGATAGLEIAIRPGKGTMIAVSHRIVNTVINRLKMPSDGDILVPAHTVAVMGTTDQQVPDPDNFAIEPWEVQHMLIEGEKIIPGFSKLRMLRAWAGVRPLYQESRTDQSRDITRSFVLLDHEERDGISGLLTITSGKWTTYRKMAEITVDKVCRKFDTDRECRTHLEVLPTISKKLDIKTRQKINPGKRKESYHLLGQRLGQVEQKHTYGRLICECELATQDDIEDAITQGQAKTLDDIRRDVRLGMGPCQGGFCTFRAAGILNHLSRTEKSISFPHASINNLNASIRDFLQERWKGLLPILWGQQLHQESLNELIYLNVLNINHLPGPTATHLGSENYRESSNPSSKTEKQKTTTAQNTFSYPSPLHSTDTLIIGAGLAGLTAAWQLAARGQNVHVVAKGWGATHWSSGCIDVLGYYPINNNKPIDTPVPVIARLALEHSNHPYAQVNLKQIEAAFHAFQSLCAEAGYPLQGTLEKNWMLPTAAGAKRPTCLAPITFITGDLSDPSPMLLIGIDGFNDFFPHFAAGNLQAQGISADGIYIQIPGLRNHQRIDAMVLARYFDDLNTVDELSNLLKPHIKGVDRVGFPAILGINDPVTFIKELETRLGRRVFEIPGLPPSISGIRLHRILVDAIQNLGGQVYQGMEVIRTQVSENKVQVEGVFTESAARPTFHIAQNYILASGGILGGGLLTDHTGSIFDPIFDLPIQAPSDMAVWFNREFLHADGHPILSAGVLTDANFKTKYDNLFSIGNNLPGDFIRERSLEGVALVSGYQVAELLG
jgi:glycerol-3-phosphate dehydrogenase